MSDKTKDESKVSAPAAASHPGEKLIQMMLENLTANQSDPSKMDALDDERYAREVAAATPVPAGYKEKAGHGFQSGWSSSKAPK